MANTKQPQKQQPHNQKRPDKRHLLAHLICAMLVIVLGAGVMIAGFVAPPLGEIHPSVLVAVGEFLTFAGALLGLDYKYKYHANFKL